MPDGTLSGEFVVEEGCTVGKVDTTSATPNGADDGTEVCGLITRRGSDGSESMAGARQTDGQADR